HLQMVLRGHPVGMVRLAVSADGRVMVSSGNTADRGTVRIWNVNTGREIRCLGQFDSVFGLTITSDGTLVALHRTNPLPGSVLVIDTDSGNSVFPSAGAARPLAFSHDGTHLALCRCERTGRGERNVIEVWQARNFVRILSIQVNGKADSLALSPDARLLAGY